MAPSNPFLSAVPLQQLYVWVLAPQLETNDPNIDYYYDFSQSIAEYTKAFNELDVEWKWQPVTLKSYKKVIESIVKKSDKDNNGLEGAIPGLVMYYNFSFCFTCDLIKSVNRYFDRVSTERWDAPLIS